MKDYIYKNIMEIYIIIFSILYFVIFIFAYLDKYKFLESYFLLKIIILTYLIVFILFLIIKDKQLSFLIGLFLLKIQFTLCYLFYDVNNFYINLFFKIS